MQTNLTSEQFDQFEGSNPKEVISKFKTHKMSWNFNFYTFKKKNIKLNPFNETCIGILTKEYYSVELKVISKAVLFLNGIVLFVSSPKLCNSSLFYYLTGVSFGVCASFLILIYIVSRFFPRKPVMYGFVIGGWTVGVYLAQLFWDNLRTIITQHKTYVIGYITFTALLSFVVCYRFGPVSNQKTRDLIKWALQGLSLVLMFCSSEFQEASLAIILIFLACYNIPLSLVFRMRNRLWYKPKVKLLTEDEYYHQGVVETKKALEELRGYCSSPECNQWKTVLKLKNPQRFANFMEGTSHLEDEEVLAFEMDVKNSSSELLTDDSSSD
ncbi:hypothetical protein AAG570_000804 [Ranatra chinensis]|uniref:Nuclear envelope integral membrane protein 1 n=1 Tax=Ranatra chinensis TaxID=642074 RepID=A0ABD0YY44_9HEMI